MPFWKKTKRNAPVSELVSATLQSSSVKMMVADCNYNIVYMNQAVTDFLSQVEHDIRQDLPNFRVSKLIGSNIDSFHKNPQQQRHMLEALQGTHSVTIRVGSQTFDLTAHALYDKRDRRIGTFVEWNDASLRLQNEDYQAQIEGISRSQAVVSFTPKGNIIEANDIFLQIMGYSRDEIIGKPHRIFVDADQAKSTQYLKFWQELEKGKPDSREVCRRTRNEKEIWFMGNYNPIRNDKGEVTKIVKYANDITFEMITRQSNENIRNMLESTATATEELSISVKEISDAMQQSRVDSDTASHLVVSVEESAKQLDASANAMLGLLEIITNITDQINLLALNATIESARAGEAGKGFAVVASEVKSLASEAAKSGEKISLEVDSLREISNQVTSSLSEVSNSIQSLQEHISTTAKAIEEQTQVTNEMSSSMAHAAQDARKRLEMAKAG